MSELSARDVLADIFENEDHMGSRPYDLADAMIRHLYVRGFEIERTPEHRCGDAATVCGNCE